MGFMCHGYAILSRTSSKRRRFFADPDEQSSDPAAYSPLDTSPLTQPKRFFKDEEDVKIEEKERIILAERSDNRHTSRNAAPGSPPSLQQESSSVIFDRDMFEALVDDKVGEDVLQIIRDHCGDNMERAVNMYFDGTYKKFLKPLTLGAFAPRPTPAAATLLEETGNSGVKREEPVVRRQMSSMRYIGAFGVEGWATRSGVNILKHGDIIKVERQKIQPPQPAKLKGNSA